MTATDEEQTVTVVGREFARRRWGRRLRRARPFLYAALALAVVLGGVWLVFFSSVVTVRDVSVQGTRTISSVRVRAVAKTPIGLQLARVDLGAIRARVETIPAVKSVSVSRSWPHTVAISITERTPVAVVDRGAGLQAVDEDGVLFGSYPRQPADLPLLQTAPDVNAEALSEAAHVVTSLRPDIRAIVDRVEVESVDRIRLHLSGGRTVMWGRAEQSAEKASVLAVLLHQKAQEIDVSVPERPTTR
ncbi:MAG TPA: FtsQ-type POTRA domain-containing protein [Marmoricola sp.]|nr:FtsQ-type POTRA domain-containing protein [Marmoricola sp.]